MSFVSTVPALVSDAATQLSGIGSSLTQANAAAAASTTSVLMAAADEVSVAVATMFGAHGQAYQALSAQVAGFHDEFVRLLSSGAAQYASAEALNVGPLPAACLT
jgi:Mrp family chromosome partitioning ATPase